MPPKNSSLALSSLRFKFPAIAGLSVVAALAILSGSAFAQVDATSSPAATADAATTTAPTATNVLSELADASSTGPAGRQSPIDIASSTTSQAALTATSTTVTPEVPAAAAKKAAPKLAHVVSTGYTDYFTDGRATFAYPGDPAVDSKLNSADAPVPARPGLRWIGSSGFPIYDTPSGALEPGDYAQNDDGSYSLSVATSTYTDATSTVSLPSRVVTSMTNPSLQ